MNTKSKIVRVKGPYRSDDDYFFKRFPVGSLQEAEEEYTGPFYRIRKNGRSTGGWFKWRFEDLTTEEPKLEDLPSFKEESILEDRIKKAINELEYKISVVATIGVLEDIKNQLLNR